MILIAVTFLLSRPAILLSYASQDICPVYKMGDNSNHMISLTFDDGPHEQKTKQILNILDRFDVKATFFVVGENVNAHPDIVDDIIERGHEIGNHTHHHKYLYGKGRRCMELEIDLCDDELYNHSEYNAVTFRPPGGLYDANLMKICAERGYSMILWSIDTRDWEGKKASEIEAEIITNVRDGSIILMHDFICGESHTAEALESVIPKLKKLGYRFVTVSELIGH